jgi:simple sugar transport system ATP-binding protein
MQFSKAGNFGEGAQAPSPIVSLKSITKTYGALKACDDVSMVLHPGRIHGILGQNGAGKSTLMKILIGLVGPDSGEIRVGGDPVRVSSPQHAADLGIGMVHQHFSLVDALTVWENVVLGDRSARLDSRRARELVSMIGDRYGLDIDPDANVGQLTAGQRQRVEIIKCLRRSPRVLIFDEPTSVLTMEESKQLFAVLRQVVRNEGATVALVSHRLGEVLESADDVVIMRDGRVIAEMPTSGTTPDELAQAMVGRKVRLRSSDAHHMRRSTRTNHVEVVLRMSDVSVASRRGGVDLDGLSLTVRAGEIVGVAGAEGNGQRVLVDVLSSLRGVTSGTIEVAGTVVETGRAGAMAAAGVGVVPEDRHDSGCVLDMTVAENLVLTSIDQMSSRGALNFSAIRESAQQMIQQFGISCPSPDVPMWTLSGGNQQRVVLARELSTKPKLLVAAQPTRGLDVSAIEYMGNRLREAANDGVGVLLISSELDEILHLSDRIVVIYKGAIIGETPNDAVDMARLGLLIGGVA